MTEKFFPLCVCLDNGRSKKVNKQFAVFYRQMICTVKNQILRKFPSLKSYGSLACSQEPAPSPFFCRAGLFHLWPVSFEKNCVIMLSFMPWSSALLQFRNQSFVCIFISFFGHTSTWVRMQIKTVVNGTNTHTKGNIKIVHKL
jgi:hypothetical protein